MKLPTTPEERYDYAYEFVEVNEGGFVDHPSDPGGTTNYGVSLRFLRQNGIDIDNDGDIDAFDVKNMTRDEAKQIFKEYFWDKGNYDAIVDIKVASKAFDMAVNMGLVQANRLIQRAVNRVSDARLSTDGVLGPKSLKAINTLILSGKSEQLMRWIRQHCKGFYESLVTSKPQLAVFLKGWLKRVAR